MRTRTIIFAIGFLLVSSIQALAAPMHLWSKAFTSSGVDAGLAVNSDVAGNVVTTGRFQFTVDFGGGNLTGFPSTFLAKYAPNGAHVWSRSYPTLCNDMAVDGSGNVIVTGVVGGTFDFGGGPSAGGNNDIYVVKYDPNGSFLWVRRFGATGGFNPRAVAADAAGNIFITGGFGSTIDFGGGPLTGALDIYVAKFDPSGAHVWSKSFGSPLFEDFGSDIDADETGGVIVTGRFGDTVSFGGSPLTSVSEADIFLVKFDVDGVHQWSRSTGGPLDDEGAAVAIDATGNVVTTGSFTGTINWGGSDLTSAGSGDVYLAKYDANGVHQWSARYGSTSSDRGMDIDLDAYGNIAVTGRFRGVVNFGGGSLTSAGAADIFVARYDAAGAHQWSQRFGSNATTPPPNSGSIDDVGYGVCIDGCGNTFATGVFGGTVDFGGGPLVGAGFEDIFLIKYGELPLPVLISNFSASERGRVVDVAWNLASDEALAAFTLYRTSDGSTRVVASGNASTRSFSDTSVEPGKSYDYELAITTVGGDVFRSPVATVNVAAIANVLEQNQPNPFNPSTTIAYTLSERASTAVDIYDAAGSLVVRLDAGEHDAGTHSVTWNGRDASGRPVASGVYFYQLEGVAGLHSRKMVLLK